MKKWLIGCLTVLAMVCLIPGIVLKAAAETVPVHCLRCGSRETREILRYEKYDSTYHRVYVTECQNCHNDGNVTLLQVHTGGTQGPTCTKGKICEKCGAEYAIPGHVWSAWKPNGNGTHTRKCTNPNCGAKEENVPCGGDSNATCTSPGVCATCGGSYYGGHSWGEWSSAGDGTHTRRCKRSNCDAVENESCSGGTGTFTCTKGKTCEKCGAEYGVLGHDWGAWTPNYNGTHGTHTRRCTRCNAEETGSCSGGYADCTSLGMCYICGGSYYGGHDWGEWSSAGNGTHIRSCKNCYKVDTASCTGGTATCSAKAVCVECGGEYGVLGHDWGGWTSNGDGAHTRSCTRCNAEETESCSGGTGTFTCTKGKTCEKCGAEYGVLGHDWGAWTPIYDGTTYTHARSCKNCPEVDTANCTGGTATCSAKAVCEVCGGKYGERNPNNHDLEQHAAKAPTCTEKGWNAYDTCSRCDYTTYVELPAQHDLEQHAAKAPTCTGPGWDAYETCSRCDYTTYAELPALNHDLVQHAAKAPTCTEKGWTAYETCNNCDYTTYAELSALNHDLVQHAAKAPTCTGIGWNAYDTCSRCDHTTYQEIPALNHDLVHHDAKAATCTEKGWDAYDTCSRCDYTTYAELSALNHDYQAVTVEPTCETDGYTVFTCSRCKDSYTADPTDRLGHQFGAWSPNETGSQSAGCLRQGCVHIGSTDCRKFTFRTAEGEALTFCPVCGQAENAAQLEKIEAATAWALSGSLSAADVTARTNGEYLSVAFETAGSLTQPTGRVRLALPAGLLEGKTLVRIAPDGTQTELPFEAKNGKLIFTLDFANSELPVMLFRLLPQTATL